MKRKILLGLTTTPQSDWREKIKEIDDLGLEEVALFPTWLQLDGRRELYALLEKTKLRRIPHVHLRDDMEEWELTYLIDRFKAEIFNMHANEATQEFLGHTRQGEKIFVENQDYVGDLFLASLDSFAGICLDVSHWEDQGIIQKHDGYGEFSGLFKKYKIGCSHISAVNDKLEILDNYLTGKKMTLYSHHWLDNMKDLDYVKKYVQYLPYYVSIELENSFKKQLEVKEYLEKIINPIK